MQLPTSIEDLDKKKKAKVSIGALQKNTYRHLSSLISANRNVQK